jgi:hypothetical protein
MRNAYNILAWKFESRRSLPSGIDGRIILKWILGK